VVNKYLFLVFTMYVGGCGEQNTKSTQKPQPPSARTVMLKKLAAHASKQEGVSHAELTTFNVYAGGTISACAILQNKKNQAAIPIVYVSTPQNGEKILKYGDVGFEGFVDVVCPLDEKHQASILNIFKKDQVDNFDATMQDIRKGMPSVSAKGWSWSHDPEIDFCQVVGKLKNTSNVSLNAVKVFATIESGGGEVVANGTGYPFNQNLDPGQSTGFKIMIFNCPKKGKTASIEVMSDQGYVGMGK
jgi:hypothetical protein